MVFVNTIKETEHVVKLLRINAVNCEAIHGSLSQAIREEIMLNFTSGICDVLVCTDLVGRGVDISNLSLVINYDCPKSAEVYTHRIGRTARAGKSGTAVTLISPRDKEVARKITRIMRQSRCAIPKDVLAMLDGDVILE